MNPRKRTVLPIIPLAYASPINRSDDAITAAFEATRETIAELEAKRTEAVCPAWSVAQHARRAS